MSDTATIEEVMKRVSELEEQLAKLNEAISTHSMTVSGDATVDGTLAAGALTEGGSALIEKYQSKGDYQPAGDYQPRGNYQLAENYVRSGGASYMQYGTAYMGAETPQIDINFPSACRDRPLVLITQVEGSPVGLLASRIKQDGFLAVKGQNPDGKCYANWIAIGE